jgi:uncharacterized protein (TIGR02270 family)
LTQLARPRLILDIVEEHFEELDFLWAQRESVVFAADWTLEELAELEERADAHLDGLRLAGGHALDLARPALAGEDAGAATAAAMTLMSFGADEPEAELLMALAAGTPEVRDGIGIGLRHSDIGRVLPRIQELSQHAETPVRVAAAGILAFHRQPPPPGITELVDEAEPTARARLYAALRRFGGPWTAEPVLEAFDGEDAALQRAALETSAHVGLPGLAELCRHAVGRPNDPPATAAEFLGVIGEESDLSLLRRSLDNPAIAPMALAGLGALGAAAAIPALLEAMRDPDLGGAAGAAFKRITGAEEIDASEPAPPPEGLDEDELELVETPPAPDPDKARDWWEREKGRFAPEGRWQVGMEVSGALDEFFDQLPLAYRRDHHLSRRAADPVGTPDIELERRARLQRLPG